MSKYDDKTAISERITLEILTDGIKMGYYVLEYLIFKDVCRFSKFEIAEKNAIICSFCRVGCPRLGLGITN